MGHMSIMMFLNLYVFVYIRRREKKAKKKEVIVTIYITFSLRRDGNFRFDCPYNRKNKYRFYTFDMLRSNTIEKKERKTLLPIEIQTEITSQEETAIMNQHASSNR